MERKDYPRVSHILDCLRDFSGIPEDVLKAKANDGTIVHKAIQTVLGKRFPVFLKDNFFDMSLEEQKLERIRAKRRYLYYRSFLNWFVELKPEFIPEYLETRFYDDELRYTGQIDAICRMSGDTVTLVDYKTSVNEDKKCWPLQAHMYRNLLTTNLKFPVSTKIIFLRLDPLGNMPTAHKYTYEDKTWEYCKQLISQWHEKNAVVLNPQVS